MGADTTGGNIPATTIQVIGESGDPVPDRIAVDLGIVDAFITNRGRTIEFRGGGLRTDVGKRDASTTTGMSVNEGEGLDDLPDEQRGRANRATIRRKPKRRRRRPDDLGGLTSLRGFRP